MLQTGSSPDASSLPLRPPPSLANTYSASPFTAYTQFPPPADPAQPAAPAPAIIPAIIPISAPFAGASSTSDAHQAAAQLRSDKDVLRLATNIPQAELHAASEVQQGPAMTAYQAMPQPASDTTLVMPWLASDAHPAHTPQPAHLPSLQPQTGARVKASPIGQAQVSAANMAFPQLGRLHTSPSRSASRAAADPFAGNESLDLDILAKAAIQKRKEQVSNTFLVAFLAAKKLLTGLLLKSKQLLLSLPTQFRRHFMGILMAPTVILSNFTGMHSWLKYMCVLRTQ